ncbi:cruciform cutting endonuclease [Ascoidea rubescens DSM 1968]|uniref:Ribonuclease H-like protein n=1 Tax=Ascoidea rubescens DSM 1968 TaxID=1344418 RepID=A0A1D2VDE1_9ASCO|nr:ribonuclease H-like protein [Ascoidea rubescens DSM 1968]ODV59619.1 ribonuclease H-like protein [Ascoidea rubescens DSM 1968]
MKNGLDIVSIDLGIKNFSYCKFTYKLNEKPEIYEWNKLNVLSLGDSLLNDLKSSSANDSQDGINTEVIETVKLNDIFNPINISNIVYTLVEKLIIGNDKPDVILIERQRTRTLNSKAVLEWTLRVNMLESMLYSTLMTRSRLLLSINKDKKLGVTGNQGLNVLSVFPKDLDKYWLNYKNHCVSQLLGQDDNDGNTQNLKKSKILRLSLIHGWFQKFMNNTDINNINVPFKFSNSIMKNMNEIIALNKQYEDKKKYSISNYIYQFNNIVSTKQKFEIENFLEKIDDSDSISNSNSDLKLKLKSKLKETKKGDDLCDSFLYGLSWIDYQINKQKIRKTLIDERTNLIDTLKDIEKHHLRYLN